MYISLNISHKNKNPCKDQPDLAINTETNVKYTACIKKHRHFKHIIETASSFGNYCRNLFTFHKLEVFEAYGPTPDIINPVFHCDKADNKSQQNHQNHGIEHTDSPLLCVRHNEYMAWKGVGGGARSL